MRHTPRAASRLRPTGARVSARSQRPERDERRFRKAADEAARADKRLAVSLEAPPLVLICGLDHVNIAEEERVFAGGGVRVRRVPARTEDEYIGECGDADGLMVQYATFSRRVFDALPRLRVLVRYGVGVDGVDLDAATEQIGRASGRE